MKSTHLSDREDLIWSMVDCLGDARIAAENNHGWHTNPYAEHSRLWHAWANEYKRTLQRLADERDRRREAAAHVASVQSRVSEPSFWQRFWDGFWNSRPRE